MSQPVQTRLSLRAAFDDLPGPAKAIAVFFCVKFAVVVLFMVMWLCGAMVLVLPWVLLLGPGFVEQLLK